MLAYTPSAPPLTPAARAEIVAALCERARRKQVANAAGNAAAKAKWNIEMAMIKQSQGRRASFHVEQSPQLSSEDMLLPTPPAQQSATTFSEASPSTYTAPKPAVAAPAAAVVSTAVETTLVAGGAQTPDRIIEGTAPSTSIGNTSKGTTSSSTIVEDKGKTEVKQDVVSVTADVRTSRSSGKDIDTTAGTPTRPIPGAETGVIRPSVVDAIESALEKLQASSSSSDAAVEKDENEGKEGVTGKPLEIAADTSVLEQVLNKEEKSDTTEEVETVPGYESGVIRPNMIDALGSMLSKLELVKQIRKRAEHDTKMLKNLGTALTASGAIATFFSMEK